ncbi:hypothetical protein [Listeria rocourtiae]|uniref:hypothetical protein n=1 Tax=Listeria rocourtiae TaxID=647910 RepID=UPI003D2F9AFB
MKKWKLGLVSIMGIVFSLTACANANDDTKALNKQIETKQEVTVKPTANKQFKLRDHVDLLGLIVTFEKATYLQDDKGDKNGVLQIAMNVENNSAVTRGFTTIDMEIKDKDGKKLAIYPSENLGEKIEAGMKVKGAGYFKVNGNGPYTIIYKDQDSDIKASWKVEVK